MNETNNTCIYNFFASAMNQIELIRKRSKNNNVIQTARIYQTANLGWFTRFCCPPIVCFSLTQSLACPGNQINSY